MKFFYENIKITKGHGHPYRGAIHGNKSGHTVGLGMATQRDRFHLCIRVLISRPLLMYMRLNWGGGVAMNI